MMIIAGDNRIFLRNHDKETEKATVPPDRPQIRLTTASTTNSIESDI